MSVLKCVTDGLFFQRINIQLLSSYFEGVSGCQKLCTGILDVAYQTELTEILNKDVCLSLEMSPNCSCVYNFVPTDCRASDALQLLFIFIG